MNSLREIGNIDLMESEGNLSQFHDDVIKGLKAQKSIFHLNISMMYKAIFCSKR